ncbi:hypothetical protein BDR04DRAFT_1115775 [Suillus decipiens]|nr:hypothetical protein BDR04DRAFT_1115775 [Suillus decipiens]
MDEVEELARKMHGLNITDAAYAACYTHLAGLAPSAAQAWPPPRSHHLVSTVPAQTPLSYLPLPPLQTPSSNYQSNPTCFFCGGPHCAPVAGNHVVMTTKDEKKKADVNAIMRSKAKENPIPSKSKDDLSPSPLIEAAPEPLDSAMKKPPAFSYESKAAAPDATQCIYKTILNMMVPHITVSDLLAISPELRKEAVEHCRTHRVPTSNTTLSASALASSIPPQVEHATPLRELRVTLNGVHSELGLLDEGSEIVVI